MNAQTRPSLPAAPSWEGAPLPGRTRGLWALAPREEGTATGLLWGAVKSSGETRAALPGNPARGAEAVCAVLERAGAAGRVWRPPSGELRGGGLASQAALRPTQASEANAASWPSAGGTGGWDQAPGAGLQAELLLATVLSLRVLRGRAALC